MSAAETAAVMVIHSDNFLEIIGLSPAEVKLKTPEMRDNLFRIAREFLVERGLIASAPAERFALSEASMRVPGTAFTIRLSAPTSEELKALVAAAAAIMLLGGADPKTVTVTSAIALMNRVKKARTEYGETSILDAIRDLPRSTAKSVSKYLYGEPCRYPKSSCRYIAANGTCSFKPKAVAATMESMAARKILFAKNAVEPIEYGIVI